MHAVRSSASIRSTRPARSSKPTGGRVLAQGHLIKPQQSKHDTGRVYKLFAQHGHPLKGPIHHRQPTIGHCTSLLPRSNGHTGNLAPTATLTSLHSNQPSRGRGTWTCPRPPWNQPSTHARKNHVPTRLATPGALGLRSSVDPRRHSTHHDQKPPRSCSTSTCHPSPVAREPATLNL